MPQGIEVYNANGSLQFGMDHRVFKVYTVSIAVGTTSSGSAAFPTLNGTNNYVVRDVLANEDTYIRPTVTKGASSVSWDYGSTAVGSRDPNYTLKVSLY